MRWASRTTRQLFATTAQPPRVLNAHYLSTVACVSPPPPAVARPRRVGAGAAGVSALLCSVVLGGVVHAATHKKHEQKLSAEEVRRRLGVVRKDVKSLSVYEADGFSHVDITFPGATGLSCFLAAQHSITANNPCVITGSPSGFIELVVPDPGAHHDVHQTMSRQANAPEPQGQLPPDRALTVYFPYKVSSFVTPGNVWMSFGRKGALTVADVELIADAIMVIEETRAREGVATGAIIGSSPWGGQETHASQSETETAVRRLESLGVTVHGIGSTASSEALSWDDLAGPAYEPLKQEIQDTVMLSVKAPDVYDRIAQGTRGKGKSEGTSSSRPKGVLFEGPPGCGKTTAARIVAEQAGVVLAHVPLESIVSKWYGESEKQLAEIFDCCSKLGNAVIFLDEIDAIGMARSGEQHEVSRRLLSVVLRKVDGFEAKDRTILIGATNRRQDLDQALLSRFDVSLRFGLPDQISRERIFSRYARHLSPKEITVLGGEMSEGMSGRDIRDVCLGAERRWASKIIRDVVKDSSSLPNLSEYQQSLQMRRKQILGELSQE